MELADDEVGMSLPVGGEVDAGDKIGTSLSVGGEFDVDQAVAVQALVTADVVGFEDREREAGKAVDMNFVGRKSFCGVDGVVVGRRHVRQQHVPVDLFCVAKIMESIWASTWSQRRNWCRGGKR